MIEINNLTTNPIDEEFLKRVAQRVLEGEKAKEELSIVFVGPGRMRKLNKKYRGKNRVTDVLVFGQDQEFPILPKSESILGEIVICLREVKKNARRCKSTFERELAKVLIHGILHLQGYSHEKSLKEAKLMEEKENFYLNQFFAKI